MAAWKNLDTLEAWKKISADEKRVNIKEALTGEAGAERMKSYKVPMAAGMTYYYGAKAVDDELLEKLCALAKEAELTEKYKELYEGAVINTGEKRLVLHQLTRGQLGADVIADGVNKREFYVRQQERIAEFAKKHDLWVISDEPYEALLYDGAVQMSIGSLPGMKERTVTCNSCSKTYAMAGLRVGWCVAPADMCLQMTKIQSSVTSSVAGAIQMGALEALTGPQDYVQEMVAEYNVRRKLMVEGLNRIRGFSCLAPEGAFYTFPNVKELGMSDYDLAFYILDKAKVVTVPGSAFGKYGEGYLRVSFCTETEKIEEGLERLEKLFGRK